MTARDAVTIEERRHIVSPEARAFVKASEVAGLELPAHIAEMIDRRAGLDAEYEKLPAPAPVPTKTELVANGTPVAKVDAEWERAALKAKNAKELRAAVHQARGALEGRISRELALERDDLILAMRPLVTDLIEKARPLAESLKRFAPKYDPQAIVRQATLEQIEDWRAAQELEERFEALVGAWRQAFGNSTRNGGHPSRDTSNRAFDPRWVPQAAWFWTWPERVLEPRLNGTHYAVGRTGPSPIRPTLLAVAAERPECEFRLATIHEVAALFYAENLQAAADKAHRERRLSVRII
jgi:hypothetical protein